MVEFLIELELNPFEQNLVSTSCCLASECISYCVTVIRWLE